MKQMVFLLSIAALVMAGCGTTPTVIDLDDLSTVTAVTASNPTPHAVNVGDVFEVGDIITETVSGVKIYVLSYLWIPGGSSYTQPIPLPPLQWTSSGFVSIVQDDCAGGSGNELHFNNACLGVVVQSPETLKKITLKFTDRGGSINLIENGDWHNYDDFTDIASPTQKGLKLLIAPFGAALRTLQLTGTMNTFTFPGPIIPALEEEVYFSAVIGGGQELCIDDIIFEQ